MQKTFGLMVFVAMAVLLPSEGLSQQPVRWESTLEIAQRQAAQTNRLVLIHFWAPWCGVCKRMEAEVLSQPAVAAELAANYVPVKINADNFPATARQYNVTGLPTTVIISPQGQLVDSMRGRFEVPEYSARLAKVAADVKQQGMAVYAQMPAGATPPAAPAQGPMVSNQPQSSMAGGPALGGIPQPSAGNGPAVAANTTPSDDRYADFFRRSQGAPAMPIAQPPATPSEPMGIQPPANYPPPAQSAVPPAGMPASSASVVQNNPPAAAPALQGQTPAPVTASMPYGSQTPPSSPQNIVNPMAAANPAPSAPSTNPAPQAQGISPPLCLDGYCPVTLAEKQQWVVGDRRWGAIHRGRTYLFAGPEEQRRFFTDPDRYAPANSGNDVVLSCEGNQSVSGMREHGVFFGNRVYLFSGEATLEKFAKNPNQYASQVLGASRSNAHVGQPLQ